MSDLPAPIDDRDDLVLDTPPGGIIADTSAPTVDLKDVIEEIAPQGEKVEAKKLVDETFTILRARPFESSFRGQAHAYFVVGELKKDKKLFNTVLGGGAVTDTLDLWARQGMSNPLRVTLRFVKGGKYKGYYTLE